MNVELRHNKGNFYGIDSKEHFFADINENENKNNDNIVSSDNKNNNDFIKIGNKITTDSSTQKQKQNGNESIVEARQTSLLNNNNSDKNKVNTTGYTKNNGLFYGVEGASKTSNNRAFW